MEKCPNPPWRVPRRGARAPEPKRLRNENNKINGYVHVYAQEHVYVWIPR